MEKFHEKLKMLRKKKGLTQQEIADEIGINRGSYSNWEKGKREPSFENLVKLADLFDVSLDWLFGREQMKFKKRSPTQLQENEKI